MNLIQAILVLAAVLESATGAVEVIYAPVGGTVTLKPPVVNDLQKSYLYWYYGNTQIAWRNSFGAVGVAAPAEHWKGKLSMSGSSLIVKDIQPENFGTFVCEVTLDGRSDKTTYQLLRLNAAMESPSPLVRGEYLTLTCSVETPQGHRTPQIHWLNPQGTIKKTNQGRLTVKVTGQDNGKWTCVVMHDNKESKAKISVMVVDFAPAPSNPQYTSESSSLTIPCSIPSHISWANLKAAGLQEVNWYFYPKPGSNLISHDPQRLFFLSREDLLTWKAVKNRELSPVLKLEKGFLTLTRKKGRDEDRGAYVCSMKLRDGITVNSTVHVQLLQITSSPGTDLISGQLVNLTCSPGEPLPSGLRLNWVPPQQSTLLSGIPDPHPMHLRIPVVGTDDGGKWRCELRQNQTLLTSAVLTLKIEPRLSVWMLVIICSVTVIMVLLLILVFIVYRRRQRKMFHTRHRLCQCKNPKPKGFYRT